jgi:hypothetical protein
MEGYMCFLKTIDGKAFEYKGARTVKDVLDFVCTAIKGSRDEFRMVANGAEVTTDNELPPPQGCIHVIRKLRGGGSCAASKTDFKSGVTTNTLKTATKTTPAWLRVGNGLNVKVECTTNGCGAQKNGGEFYVKLGFGVFDMCAAEFQSFSCPGCNKPSTLPFITIALVDECEYTIIGEKAPGTTTTTADRGLHLTGKQTVKNQCTEFLTSPNGPPQVHQWKFLKIRVRMSVLPSIDLADE